MRRILVVGGLVVLLAAAIVVPAIAQEDSSNNLLANLIPKAALAQALFNAGGEPLLEAFGLTTDDITDNPNVANSNAARNSSEDPGVQSSSSSSNPSSSSNSSDSSASSLDTSNDPDAAVSQEFSERRITSGKASPSFSVSNSGDNANICPTGQQIVNTGNVANQQGVSQYASTTDDIDLSGSSISIDSSATGTCTQTIEQSTASGP